MVRKVTVGEIKYLQLAGLGCQLGPIGLMLFTLHLPFTALSVDKILHTHL